MATTEQYVNGVPVFKHKVETTRQDGDNLRVETNNFTTRWEAVSYAVQVIKSHSALSVRPLSWARETGFSFDPKSQADIEKRLQGTPKESHALSAYVVQRLRETGELTIARSKLAAKSGLTDENITELGLEFFRTMRELGIPRPALNALVRQAYEPQAQEAPAAQ